MRVLMLSLDSSLLDVQSNAYNRHLAYAERAGHLTIIVRSVRHRAEALHPSPALTLLSSGSLHPATYPWDILRLGRRLPAHDLIVTQDMFTSGLGGVWLRSRSKTPLLVQNHSTVFDNAAWLAEKPLRNRVLLALARFVRSRSDFLRTVNRLEAERAIAAGLPAERVAALPLGTVSERFMTPADPEATAALRRSLNLTPDQPVVLWVGYPVAFKRVPLLIEVFERLLTQVPQARLVLIGDLRRSAVDLPALVRARGLSDAVRMTGEIHHDQLPAYYAMAQVYVHTSSYEGVPRVLMEASACGLPLVAMAVPGVEEVVENSVNGWLAADGDVDAMAERLVVLLADGEMRRAFGQVGRQQAVERYSAEAYADRWVALWRRAYALGVRQ